MRKRLLSILPIAPLRPKFLDKPSEQVRGPHARQNQIKMNFIWFCARLIVTLSRICKIL